MPAYLSAHTINGKRENQTLQSVAAHNTRSIKAELRGGPGARIDPSRVHLNRTLAGPETAAGIVALHAHILDQHGVKPKRKDQITLIECVVDPKQELADLMGFFEESRQWLVCWYDCPLLHAVVHFDEVSPHMHCLFVPIRDGRLQGDAVMGKRHDLIRMQLDFHATVGKRFGIEAVTKVGAAERRLISRQIVAALDPAGKLDANQKHQLGRALQAAPDFAGLASAFGMDDQLNHQPPSTPIGVQKPSIPDGMSGGEKSQPLTMCRGLPDSPQNTSHEEGTKQVDERDAA